MTVLQKKDMMTMKKKKLDEKKKTEGESI